jgi:serine/threonine protein phosphatase 1
MPETLFIIGDIHGCYHTFRALVETYWQPETMLLIQLGDMTDRGRFIPETIAYARQLEEQYPERTVFLKGNHEAMVLELWTIVESASSFIATMYSRENSTMFQYFTHPKAKDRLSADMAWLRTLPLVWQNNDVFVSHAGISRECRTIDDALREDHSESVLWTRNTLKNIDKVQVIGHTPLKTGKAQYRKSENCWNIDTAAVFGVHLTALHCSLEGTVLDIFSIPTERIDYQHPQQL